MSYFSSRALLYFFIAFIVFPLGVRLESTTVCLRISLIASKLLDIPVSPLPFQLDTMTCQKWSQLSFGQHQKERAKNSEKESETELYEIVQCVREDLRYNVYEAQ